MAGFFHPISCKIAAAMEKERTARKSEEEERRSIYEKAGCTLSFNYGHFGDSLMPKKKLFDVRGTFSDNILKKPARYSYNGVYPLTSLFLERFWRRF